MCTKTHSCSPISLPGIAYVDNQLWYNGEAEVKGHEKIQNFLAKKLSCHELQVLYTFQS